MLPDLKTKPCKTVCKNDDFLYGKMCAILAGEIHCQCMKSKTFWLIYICSLAEELDVELNCDEAGVCFLQFQAPVIKGN